MRFAALLLAVLALAADPAEKSDRLPVPDAAAQRKAEKTIRDVFKDEYAKKRPAERIALADRLLKEAVETKDDPSARYVLLREARDLAAKAGDVAIATLAAEEIALRYEVATSQARLDMLRLIDPAYAPAAAVKAAFESALAWAEEAADADDYASADKYLRFAAAAALKSKGALNGLAVTARIKELERTKAEFDTIKADRETLKTRPDDAGAAGRVGRFLCLFKGDWAEGLPLLARGSHEKLTALAKKDLENPEEAAARVALADGWYDCAAGLDRDLRAEALRRAQHWYKQAVADLSGLTQTRVEKRIAELEQTAAGRGSASAGGGWTVLFRSADPSIWNRDVNKGPNNRAVKLEKAPDGVRYLRLTECARNAYVIVEIEKADLGKRVETGGYGWNGTAHNEWGGRQLGVYDPAWTRIVKGDPLPYIQGILQGTRGWGFGPCHEERRQGWCWNGANLGRPTVFEVAVKTGGLTAEETKRLLKKKK